MSEQQKQPDPGEHSSHERSSSARRTIPSEQLLQGAREVFIEHAGEFYRLRVTRSGKLILHK